MLHSRPYISQNLPINLSTTLAFKSSRDNPNSHFLSLFSSSSFSVFQPTACLHCQRFSWQHFFFFRDSADRSSSFSVLSAFVIPFLMFIFLSLGLPLLKLAWSPFPSISYHRNVLFMERALHSGTRYSGRPVIFISAIKFQFPSVPPVNFSAIMVY